MEITALLMESTMGNTSVKNSVGAGHCHIIYDGQCSLCTALVQFLQKMDKHQKLRYLPIEDQSTQSILRSLSLPTNPDAVVFITKHKVATGIDAISSIFHKLGGIWKFPAFLCTAFRKILAPIYTHIATNRYKYFKKK